MNPDLKHLKCTACVIGVILSVLAGNVERSKSPFRRRPRKFRVPHPVR